MTTRTQGPNEVFLNDTFFPIVGKVRSSIASNYPQKRITGDFDKDSQRRVSVFTWDDHRGGMGVDRMTLAQGNRCSDAGMNIRHKGHLTANGLTAGLVPTGFTNAKVLCMSELGGLLVSAQGTDVQSRAANDVFTSRHTTAASPTDCRNGSISGNETLVFCYTTGYAHSTAIATWGTSTKDALNIEFHEDRLWGIDATGQLWYTFTPGSSEVNDAVLPLERGAVVTGLIRARDNTGAYILYALSSRGLYAHDIGNRKFIKVEGVVFNHTEVTQERPAVVWRERIYIAAGASIIEYDPVAATVRNVGFDQDDGPVAGQQAPVGNLAASINELFAGTIPRDSNDEATIMAWDGIGWSKLHQENADSIHSLYVSYDLSSEGAFDFIWAGRTVGAAHDILQTRINTSSILPKNINSWDYTVGDFRKRHLFSIFDGGQRDVIKVALKLKVEVETASSTQAVKVFVDFDGSGLTQLTDTETNGFTFNAANDQIQGDGITTFFFPSVASPAGKEFRFLQIALEINKSNTIDSPDILAVTLEYLKILDEKLSFDFEIDFSQDHDGKSPEQLRASYATARALKTMPEFTFRDDTGGNRNYYVKVFADQGEEESGHEERGTELVHCEEI